MVAGWIVELRFLPVGFVLLFSWPGLPLAHISVRYSSCELRTYGLRIVSKSLDLLSGSLNLQIFCVLLIIATIVKHSSEHCISADLINVFDKAGSMGNSAI